MIHDYPMLFDSPMSGDRPVLLSSRSHTRAGYSGCLNLHVPIMEHWALGGVGIWVLLEIGMSALLIARNGNFFLYGFIMIH